MGRLVFLSRHVSGADDDARPEFGQNQGGSAETGCRENRARIGRRSTKNGLCPPGYVMQTIKNPAKLRGWWHNQESMKTTLMAVG
jgi:hypothetical protein